MPNHLVRMGALGHIGQFASLDSLLFRRGTRVICRSQRGLEIGSVLTVVQHGHLLPQPDGTILRRAITEDELLWARIEKNQTSAFQDCQRLLDDQDAQAALMDVELLFDGRSIYFYFLGEVTSEVEELVSELAETYEARVQLRQFGEAMLSGCGPDCGTDAAAGCGDSCNACAIAGACATKPS